MQALGFLVETQVPDTAARAVLARGCVTAACDGAGVEVTLADGQVIRCQILQSSEGEVLQLADGEMVLVWAEDLGNAAKSGVILGRLGSRVVSCEPMGALDTDHQSVPDHLLIEAAQSLTLKCGEGSITLRADGKILIKGQDLVSQAKRMNRIKGGAVAIN